MTTEYTKEFYDEVDSEALVAAAEMLPPLIKSLDITSVTDVGCARGAWLSVAKELGCSVRGVDFYDGPLLIDPEEFVHQDLQQGVDCSGFDLALCLEVGEHLPEESAPVLVRGLCQAKYVLFSAAIPGQPGVNHQNCHWQSWWALLFAEQGYVGSTEVRDRHWTDKRIVYWYRQNIVLYSSTALNVVLPEVLR